MCQFRVLSLKREENAVKSKLCTYKWPEPWTGVPPIVCSPSCAECPMGVKLKWANSLPRLVNSPDLQFSRRKKEYYITSSRCVCTQFNEKKWNEVNQNTFENIEILFCVRYKHIHQSLNDDVVMTRKWGLSLIESQTFDDIDRVEIYVSVRDVYDQ